ncbi:hypothetical protein [Pseudomonas phage ZCPS1]|uniref:Constituent protein n=1 Tax=Pseudomonas phage Epa1 TaxID=2719568 RepID=A0A6G9LIL7_9CAUD|nr:putative constituent protein [Pseudomonas phage MR299-2]ATW62324.1 constituent protein [Pseudomonas phage Delta]QIQ64392.1 constituent protein [Pseudomonas phage Epa1]QIQ66492.1 structural protein [Pseudomonas phage clash]QIQ67463.1 structural protein [Pseudomonas phage otherone]QSH71730.1 putative constituent protein/ tail tubular protein [Pseudomonas phage vB_PaeP_fHoPae04]QYC95365.1 hypothetical protein [Pseudomonas phage PhL_UNISO_PA-DSM_ph0041x]UPO63081.1 hypothetical protein [Pseudo
MATINNVTDLAIAAIQWSDRQDLTQELLMLFIGNTTDRLNRLLRVRENEHFETLMAFGGGIEIPEHFVALRSITGDALIGGRTLQYITQDIFSHYVNYNYQPQGVTYYTRLGNFWRVYPVVPDGAPFIVNYWTVLPELSLANPTTWALTKYPQIYLYGVLEQIYLYTMDEERSMFWGQKLERAVMELQNEENAADFASSRLAIKDIER